MPEFFRLSPIDEALKTIFSALDQKGFSARVETVPTSKALGRVVGAGIISPESLPAFAKSTMDGYAVTSADTAGASESLPSYLKVIGELVMGRAPAVSLKAGEAVLIHTGGMLPEGADAVVMIEHTQMSTEAEVEVLRPAAPGENVIQAGEELKTDDPLFGPGHLLRPQDIGGLLAVGILQVPVFAPPRVAICTTGDEVIPPETVPETAQVRDINSSTLAGIVAEAGGVPFPLGIFPDNFEKVLGGVRQGLEEADIVVISAGSSVSTRDLTAKVIDGLGKPGVLVHGVAVKPGKPTILGVCGGKPVVGLPGNPVSAFVTASLFLVPLIRRFLSLRELPVPCLPAVLTRNYRSPVGRKEYLPVRIYYEDGRYRAEPVFGKSNLIFTLVRGQGLVEIPLDSGGIHEGDNVEVRFFQPGVPIDGAAGQEREER